MAEYLLRRFPGCSHVQPKNAFQLLCSNVRCTQLLNIATMLLGQGNQFKDVSFDLGVVSLDFPALSDAVKVCPERCNLLSSVVESAHTDRHCSPANALRRHQKRMPRTRVILTPVLFRLQTPALASPQSISPDSSPPSPKLMLPLPAGLGALAWASPSPTSSFGYAFFSFQFLRDHNF